MAPSATGHGPQINQRLAARTRTRTREGEFWLRRTVTHPERRAEASYIPGDPTKSALLRGRRRPRRAGARSRVGQRTKALLGRTRCVRRIGTTSARLRAPDRRELEHRCCRNEQKQQHRRRGGRRCDVPEKDPHTARPARPLSCATRPARPLPLHLRPTQRTELASGATGLGDAQTPCIRLTPSVDRRPPSTSQVRTLRRARLRIQRNNRYALGVGNDEYGRAQAEVIVDSAVFCPGSHEARLGRCAQRQ
jgi:hypothetical protein